MKAAVPKPVDVRAAVERFETRYSGVDLRARRDAGRPVRTPRTFSARLKDQLTERQFHVLKSAYFAGYFEWPRRSNGETVAETLDVQPPTFRYHLRAGQRKLLSMLLDG